VVRYSRIAPIPAEASETMAKAPTSWETVIAVRGAAF
jgi:hypothetical protein